MGIADVLGNLAQVLAEAGELSRAIALHRESLILRRDIGDWLSVPYSLEWIGAAAISAKCIAPAIRILAVSDALRKATGSPMTVTDQAQHEEVIEQAKGCLGNDAFSALWRDGQRMGRDEAVEAALALCESIAAGQNQEAESP